MRAAAMFVQLYSLMYNACFIVIYHEQLLCVCEV
jgi:hypothetical protein